MTIMPDFIVWIVALAWPVGVLLVLISAACAIAMTDWQRVLRDAPVD